MHLSLFIILEFLAFGCSLLCFRRLRTSFLKWFPLFLLVTLMVESGSQWLYMIYKVNTGQLYNLFICIQIVFFLMMFYTESKRFLTKRITLISICVFVSFYILNLVLIQGTFSFNYISYLVGAFLIILNACLYFMEIISNDYPTPLTKQPQFWITSGTLIFFTGSFFYFLFWFYLVNRNIDSDGSLYRLILNVLNIIFYTSLIVGFLCPKPIRK